MATESRETIFNKIVMEQIRKHLEIDTSGKEVYGWLIGYDDGQDVFILASMPCFNYDVQTVIAARPTPEEISILSSSLPEGLGIVGIYHSHPKDVFHSKTDDATILNFGVMYSNFVSLVTNRKGVTKVYRIVDFEKRVIREVDYEIRKIVSQKILSVKIEISGKALVDKDYPIPSLTTGIRKEVKKIFEEEKIKAKKVEILPGIKVSEIPSKEIEIKRKGSSKWEDPEAPNLMEVEYNVEADIPVYYPNNKVFTKKTIDSIRISLTDLLLKKISFGEIINGKLKPGMTLYFDYIGITLFTAFGTKRQQNVTSVNFIRGMIAKSKLLKKAGYNKYAIEILKACKIFFEYIGDNEEKRKLEEILRTF